MTDEVNENEYTEELSEYTENEESHVDTSTSWYTLDYQEYYLTYTPTPNIPTGLYDTVSNPDFGVGLRKVDYPLDDIFLLSDMPYTKIINDLALFWNSTDKFKKLNLKPHHSILLYGESGCGKTSIIHKIIEELKAFDGVAVRLTDPIAWAGLASAIGRIEIDRPIICIIERLDKVINKFGEDNFLQLLDELTSINNIVYIATTNDIHSISNNIQNKPSRFNKKYRVEKPTNTARKEYFTKKLAAIDEKPVKLDKLVKDTKGFTMTQLREFFISVFVFNYNYNETLSDLRSVKSMLQSPKFLDRE